MKTIKYICSKCDNAITTQLSNFKRKKGTLCKSCTSRARWLTHGKTKTPLHVVWLGIRDRCNNQNNIAYKYYGEKGAKVCDEWNNFETFETWAKNNNWVKGCHISRNGDKGDYTPLNCTVKTSKVNLAERNKKNGKLNGNNIKEIKEMYKNGMIQKEIAEKFKVTQGAIAYHTKGVR